MVSALVVDDHPVVRRGVKCLLEGSELGLEVDEAGDVHDAIRAFRSREYALAVLDIDLPEQGGLDLLKRLRRIQESCAVLMFSHYCEQLFGLRALRAGAMGYLNKSADPGELIRAVRRLLGGRRYITTDLAERLVCEFSQSQANVEPHVALSDRELQVFRMLASGVATSQIAGELCLSVKTVHTHRARAMRKTGLKNNAEIARYAVGKGLIGAP
jgi:DNA-binding NarL/FixJ family response regulator